MRITEIELKGKRHILCLNLWALKRIFEHWGDYSAAIKAISEGPMLERTGERLVFLHTLLLGGAIYAAEMGMENPEPPEISELIKNDINGFLAKLPEYLGETLTKSLSVDVKTKREGGGSSGAMSPAWFLWYGLKMGLNYRETHALPLGELLDLIAVEQVKHEGAKLERSEEEEFFALLERM